MERSIIVFMTTILRIIKRNYFLIILLALFIFRSSLINLLANINTYITKPDNYENAEINILKEENNSLKEELQNLSNLEIYANYGYSLTRLSYRNIYDNYEIYIQGGSEKKYQENYAVINSAGLVGIIDSVNKNDSKVRLLSGIPSLSVKINDTYGTLSGYEDNLLIISNISNYSKINLNDEVYTSTLGAIKEKILVGTVYKVEDKDIEKKIYVKSKVDFNNLNYLYVVGV